MKKTTLSLVVALSAVLLAGCGAKEDTSDAMPVNKPVSAEEQAAAQARIQNNPDPKAGVDAPREDGK